MRMNPGTEYILADYIEFKTRLDRALCLRRSYSILGKTIHWLRA